MEAGPREHLGGVCRELVYDPRSNGEYALQGWVLEALEDWPDRNAASVILDVGANLGDWSANFLDELRVRDLNRAARIYAFEPAPDQRASLMDRLADEIKTGTVSVHRLAVGAEAGHVRFVVTGADSGTSAIATGEDSASGSKIEVDVATLDDIAKELEIDKVLFLKIDTEGNDFNVISGASRILEEERVKVVQFEYNWRWMAFGHWLKTVFQFIENRNYSLGMLTQNGMEIHSVWHPELDRYIETNYVLVRRDFLARLPHCHMTFDASNTPVEV